MKLNILVAGCLFAAVAAVPAAAQQTTYTAQLLGSNEEPTPNDSPGTGTAIVTIDINGSARTMQIQESFNDLVAGTTVSHIHCCTSAPDGGTAMPATQVPSFVNFPTGVTSGTYNMTFNMNDEDSYNPMFVENNGGTAASAFDALVAGLDSGRAYANIHTTTYPAGEIRGTLVPEPETYAMLLAGLAMVGAMARRRRV